MILLEGWLSTAVSSTRPFNGVSSAATRDYTQAKAARAAKYARLVYSARQGWAKVTERDDDMDVAFLEIPADLVPVVMGRNGDNLLKTGSDTGTICFMVDDGTSMTPSTKIDWNVGSTPAPKPAEEEWISVGKRVEFRKAGDVRSSMWSELWPPVAQPFPKTMSLLPDFFSGIFWALPPLIAVAC